MVSEEGFTALVCRLVEHALMLGDVVPVTETVAPTVRSVVSALLAFPPVETKDRRSTAARGKQKAVDAAARAVIELLQGSELGP